MSQSLDYILKNVVAKTAKQASLVQLDNLTDGIQRTFDYVLQVLAAPTSIQQQVRDAALADTGNPFAMQLAAILTVWLTPEIQGDQGTRDQIVAALSYRAQNSIDTLQYFRDWRAAQPAGPPPGPGPMPGNPGRNEN